MIVADTHAIVWWLATPELLSRSAADAIESADLIVVASITLWEIASLAQRRRIGLRVNITEWLHDFVAQPWIRVTPLTLEIAVLAAEVSEPVRDPADRLVVATALHHDLPLVTADRKIHASGLVSTIW